MKTRQISKQSLSKKLSEPWVDTARRVYCEGDTAYVPVKEGLPFDTEIPDRVPYSGPGYGDPVRDFRDRKCVV